MKYLKVIIVSMIMAGGVYAAQGETLWTRTYGGDNTDGGVSVQETQDGGFIIAGYTKSYGAGDADVYIIRTDGNGNTLWTKTYGGSNWDQGMSVQQTTDGGFIIAGWIHSSGAKGDDVYLIRTDENGNTLWTKTYGGNDDDRGYSLQETHDGGFIIAGWTSSYGSGNSDVYLIRTDENGNTLWTKTYGGSGNEVGYSVQQTTDGGFIIAGYTYQDVYNSDVYLIRTDENGNTLWTKTYGGSGSELGFSVQQTTDGGFIIAGYTDSYGAGNGDVYLIRTDENGNTLWTKTYGGSDYDEGYSVRQTTDGGFIIAGYTDSYGAGNDDVYLIRTDENGNTLWTRTYGGSDYDEGYSVQQTTDGGFIIAGYTDSYGAGNGDVYLIRTTPLIHLLSPNGGDTLKGNSTYNIVWQCDNTSNVNYYRLLLSTDGGMTYPDIIATNIQNTDTSYAWTVPDSINSGACKIKIEALNTSSKSNKVVAYDVSDSTFIISPLGAKERPLMPRSFAIREASNPITGYTIIYYQLPHKSRVSLKIYNAAGRLVKDLVKGEEKAGYYSIRWDARGIKSGIYFIEFKADNYKDTRKIVVR